MAGELGDDGAGEAGADLRRCPAWAPATVSGCTDGSTVEASVAAATARSVSRVVSWVVIGSSLGVPTMRAASFGPFEPGVA